MSDTLPDREAIQWESRRKGSEIQPHYPLSVANEANQHYVEHFQQIRQEGVERRNRGVAGRHLREATDQCNRDATDQRDRAIAARYVREAKERCNREATRQFDWSLGGRRHYTDRGRLYILRSDGLFNEVQQLETKSDKPQYHDRNPSAPGRARKAEPFNENGSNQRLNELGEMQGNHLDRRVRVPFCLIWETPVRSSSENKSEQIL